MYGYYVIPFRISLSENLLRLQRCHYYMHMVQHDLEFHYLTVQIWGLLSVYSFSRFVNRTNIERVQSFCKGCHNRSITKCNRLLQFSFKCVVNDVVLLVCQKCYKYWEPPKFVFIAAYAATPTAWVQFPSQAVRVSYDSSFLQVAADQGIFSCVVKPVLLTGQDRVDLHTVA